MTNETRTWQTMLITMEPNFFNDLPLTIRKKISETIAVVDVECSNCFFFVALPYALHPLSFDICYSQCLFLLLITFSFSEFLFSITRCLCF